MIVATLCVALASALCPSDWTYTVPAADDPFHRPPLRAVPLGTEPPEGVRVDVAFAGEWQRFGALRYGDADSRRVAIAVDQLEGGRVALYVDAGRDLVLDASDRVAELAPGTFAVDLEAWTTEAGGEVRRTQRRVELELGRTGAILGCATLGFVAGEVALGERRARVVWRDGDANGLFADEQDQLWLDLDGDGSFAPLAELFLVQPILTLAGARYACRAERLGRSLVCDAVEGEGKVALLPPPGVGADAVVEARAVLVGRDGTSVVALAPGEPAEVPVGEYRLTSVTLRLADPAGGEPFSYVFTDDRGEAHATWRTVEDGATLAFDPLGALTFTLEGPRGAGLVPGAFSALQPSLRTSDGLLVVTCYRGREAVSARGGEALHAETTVVDSEGEVLARVRSGFA